MFEIIKPGTKFDFVGKRHIWLGLSALAMVGTIFLFFTKGLNYGIDFTGGAEVQVHVPAGWDIGKLRSELEAGGIKSPKVQQVGEVKESSFLIKVQGDESTLKLVAGQVDAALNKTLKKSEYEVQRADVVGPAAGGSLRQSGFLSMFYALLCILIYVTIRFDYRYSPGAVLALVHDTLITMGVFILTQKQFDLQILAAILALIGYSNNDTIIVFDRVRETLHANPKLAIADAVNKSINETLGRTILTSASTFLTVFSLWLFGGKVIEDFAFTLMIGIFVGTYSSVFIASSAVIYMSNYYESRRGGNSKAKKDKKSQLRRPRSAELESSRASS